MFFGIAKRIFIKIIGYSILFFVACYVLSLTSIHLSFAQIEYLWLWSLPLPILAGMRLYYVKQSKNNLGFGSQIIGDGYGFFYWVYMANYILFILWYRGVFPIYIKTGFYGTEFFLMVFLFSIFYFIQRYNKYRLFFSMLPIFGIWSMALWFAYTFQKIPLLPNIYDWFCHFSIIQQGIITTIVMSIFFIPILVNSTRLINKKYVAFLLIAIGMFVYGTYSIKNNFIYSYEYKASPYTVLQKNGIFTTVFLLHLLTNSSHKNSPKD